MCAMGAGVMLCMLFCILEEAEGRVPFATGATVMRNVMEVVLHVLEAEKDVRHVLWAR